MVRHRLPISLPGDRVAPVRPDDALPLTQDGLLAEASQNWKPDFATPTRDFQSVLRRVAELARILTGAAGSAIAFRGELGTFCRARSGEGGPPLGSIVDTTSGISRLCLESGVSLHCDDISLDARVDPEIFHAIGMRSIAVVPISSDGELSGILEVFSDRPAAFNDLHLRMLEHLASLVGSPSDAPPPAPAAAPPPAPPPRPHALTPPKFLVEHEPGFRNFFQNTEAMLSPAPPLAPAAQSDRWNRVFVASQVPWQRFFESICLHVLLIALVAGMVRVWPQELTFSKRSLREAQITYYPPSFPVSDSSRPAPSPRRRPSAPREEATRNVLRVPPGLRSRSAAEKSNVASSVAPPAYPISNYRKPGLGASAAVLPAPPVEAAAAARRAQLPSASVVAPPPELAGAAGSRAVKAPGAGVIPPSPDVQPATSASRLGKAGQPGVGSFGPSDASVVPPPPSINDHPALIHGAAGLGSGTGAQVVAPPPSVQSSDRIGARASGGQLGNGVSQVVAPPPSVQSSDRIGARASGGQLGNGVSQVVAPPPSLEGASGLGGRARGTANTNAQVVPPPPSLQGGETGQPGRGMTNLPHAGAQVVPPPPSVDARGSGSSIGDGRSRSLATGRPDVTPPPAALAGSANPSSAPASSSAGPATAGASPSATAPAATSSEPGDAGSTSTSASASDSQQAARSPAPAPQDVPLRIISVAWAPPRSSYFSNYEVFIAEIRMNKQSQLIKLVYEFLPYQRRLSEYGAESAKVRKLRVIRDPRCDESLMQIEWSEADNARVSSDPASAARAAQAADQKNKLPCYRTTADDFRRAISGSK